MRTALIIEDDADAALILADIVGQCGLQAITTPSGEEGIRLARDRRPDVVFLDLMLPDIDGFKVCESLKVDRDTNRMPVILVTALATDEHRLRGFRVGADWYITKPYTKVQIEDGLARMRERAVRLQQDAIDHALEIELSSEISSLSSVNELLSLVLTTTDMSEEDVSELRNAIHELGSNAIEWGNKKDTSKIVRIRCEILADRVEIEIADQGEGFDPSNLPHAADGGDDPTGHFGVREMLGLREGGFGILIARGMCDVCYNDKGNMVRLTKRIKAAVDPGG